ncbi:hypothetical protein FRC08_002450 [Ceratobasidium sp. 394]|nr:hypothetical protein FRC08_002450 [Ceratobasidium sp. 394]
MEIDLTVDTPSSPSLGASTAPTVVDNPSPALSPSFAPDEQAAEAMVVGEVPTVPSPPPLPWNHGLLVGTVSLELSNQIVFAKLGGEIIVLHYIVLARASEVLADMFSIRGDTDPEGEGRTATRPWSLDESAPTEQWQAFLSFAYPQHYSVQPVPRDMQWHLALLAFAHKFQAPWAFSAAKASLQSERLLLSPEGDMSAVRRLYLGCVYELDDWISQATPEVARVSPDQYSVEEHILLGHATITLLDKLHGRLGRHRQQLAINLPGLLAGHHPHCDNPSHCWENWRSTCHQIMCGLFRLEDPFTERYILNLLQHPNYEVAAMDKMSPPCVEKIVRIASRSLLGRDEELVSLVIKEIRLL